MNVARKFDPFSFRSFCLAQVVKRDFYFLVSLLSSFEGRQIFGALHLFLTTHITTQMCPNIVTDGWNH